MNGAQHFRWGPSLRSFPLPPRLFIDLSCVMGILVLAPAIFRIDKVNLSHTAHYDVFVC